jgi:hypothetical protein
MLRQWALKPALSVTMTCAMALGGLVASMSQDRRDSAALLNEVNDQDSDRQAPEANRGESGQANRQAVPDRQAGAEGDSDDDDNGNGKGKRNGKSKAGAEGDSDDDDNGNGKGKRNGKSKDKAPKPDDPLPPITMTPTKPNTMELTKSIATSQSATAGAALGQPLPGSNVQFPVPIVPPSLFEPLGNSSKIPEARDMFPPFSPHFKKSSKGADASGTLEPPPSLGNPTAGVEQAGDGGKLPFGDDPVLARLTVRGKTIPLVYYSTLGGSRIGFLPPMEINRDEGGRLRVFLVDRDTGYHVADKTGTPVPLGDFVQAVLRKEIDRDRLFYVTLEILVWNDAETLAALLRGARVVLGTKVEDPARSAEPGAETDMESLDPSSVAIAAIREVRFVCESPGCEKIGIARWPKAHMPGRVEEFTIEAPAWFLCRLCSSAGVSFRVEYDFDTYRGEYHEARIFEDVREFMKVTAEELGEGGLSTHDQTLVGKDGTHTNDRKWTILLSRDQALEIFERMQTKSRMHFQGVNTSLLDGLNQNMHRHYKDLPTATAEQVGYFLSHTLGWKARLQEFGYAGRIDGVVSRQDYKGEGRRLLEEMLDVKGKSSQLAAELKVLVKKLPLGFQFGGGKVTENAHGQIEFDEEFAQNFLNALYAISQGGRFPIPPKVDLVLVSEQDLRVQFDQVVTHVKPGAVRTYTLSSSFTSRATPHLPASDPRPTVPKIKATQRVRMHMTPK